MASLIHESKNRTGFRLQAYDASDSRRRHSIWLGDISAREAETIKRHIEAVIESQKLGTPMPGETQRWLAKIADSLRRKLAAILGTARSVTEACEAYNQFCESEHKSSTARSVAATLDQFAAEFGRMQMRSLAAEDVDRWIQTRNVGSNTTAKIAKHLKTFVKWSKKQGWIDDLHISASSAVGVGDKEFIAVADFDGILKSFHKQPEMQCALAIARWAGVRVPSEILLLTRSSIDFEQQRLRVIDSKRTKRSSRGPPGVRELPLFPELILYLEMVWSLSEEPTDWLLPSIVAMGGNTFVARCRKARDEAGMSWPRLFSSLRATRETELITRFGLKAACEWIGNSPAVAIKHYELITAETWKEATTVLGPSTTSRDKQMR